LSFITFIYVQYVGSSSLHRGEVHWRRKWCRKSWPFWRTERHVASYRISAV